MERIQEQENTARARYSKTAQVPWDGRYCERLACWRKTKFGQDKRFRNQVDHCVCTNYFEGDNCDKIIGCMNGGELQDHRYIVFFSVELFL
ncbi:hypothetical protein ANCDUO_01129 [Ancylostoma duodenale]|uniref:EGF-like domain-containing protein n=1 Tax=Ancylostoma duodenale TaxID=51022 RepID=A0A0C2DZQ3_9BILA|nr:hypothetical protein ANCDUO_01129 [Ancylostoma duodenale]